MNDAEKKRGRRYGWMAVIPGLLLLQSCASTGYSDRGGALGYADALEEKGYTSKARRVRDGAGRDGTGRSPRHDPYHFPELRVPEEERDYTIRISTVPAKDSSAPAD